MPQTPEHHARVWVEGFRVKVLGSGLGFGVQSRVTMLLVLLFARGGAVGLLRPAAMPIVLFRSLIEYKATHRCYQAVYA